MTELLVGTKKGLFVLQGEPGSRFEVTGRAFAGWAVDYAMRDPRSGRLLATMTSPFYGPKIFLADDPAGEWSQADGVALPAAGDEALVRIWVIEAVEEDGALYAGGDPGVLFESVDSGASWRINETLWEHRKRNRGSRAAAGCVCTRSCRGRGSLRGWRWQSPPRECG